jgi:hypothetical protein
MIPVKTETWDIYIYIYIYIERERERERERLKQSATNTCKLIDAKPSRT